MRRGRSPKLPQQKTSASASATCTRRRSCRSGCPRSSNLAEGARDVHVLMNECYSDYAVTDARQFMDLLSGADVAVAPPEGEAPRSMCR
jgi:hypothetical protein